MLLRIALLAAVLGGLLGMHVLTAGHDSGGHGALPASSAGHTTAMHAGAPTADHADAMAASAAAEMHAAALPAGPAQVVAAASPMGTGADLSAGACVLFLAFGAVLIGLTLLWRQGVGATGTNGSWLRQLLMSLQRRGPPRSPLYNTLCVIRI